jgi:DNA-binding response OmpR family regulator/REP element-mobilizing transposase RayT
MATLVLLIDSDIAFMVNIKKALEDTGQFRVSLAANGPAAKDALRRVPHDVAVVDFEVPDRDIMELLRLLRQTQPGLPVIIAPRNDFQHERAQFLDVQGVIVRPYTARSLIPYVRDVIGRSDPNKARFTPPPESPPMADDDDMAEFEIPATLRDLFSEDEPGQILDADERRRLREQIEFLDSESDFDTGFDLDSPTGILEEFEAMERAQTGMLDLPDETPVLDDPDRTRYLGDADQPDEASVLDDPDRTRYLGDVGPSPETRRPESTEAFSERPKSSTRPLPPRPDEPPRQPDDTPTVPEQDLDGVRQFLATDTGQHDPTGFGEVLDAVAQSQPSDFERSPDDRAFHDLVDSMRGPEPPGKPRTWLEELLSSIAADALHDAPPPEASGALDYVLDVIRHNVPLVPSGESDLDESTIGEVIEGLFEPSFEGVLAALSGEEIDVIDYDEPSYAPSAAESLDPQASDRLTPEEMSDEDRPAWLDDYEAEGIEPPSMLPEQIAGMAIPEPPITEEDSSKYPATAVLSAAESGDEFSFDDLLSQIEQQLPPAHARRPALKPLPSWDTDALRAPEVQALFDRAEGIRPEAPDPDDVADALADAGPEILEEEESQLNAQDTRPSVAFREEIESAAFQERDTQPYGPVLSDDERARPIEIWEDTTGGEIPMLSMEDLMAMAGRPVEAETDDIQQAPPPAAPVQPEPDAPDEESESEAEIAQAFYAGVREDLPYRDEAPDDIRIPDDDHLIPVPVEDTARLYEEDAAIDEEAEIAQAAVQLTQFALESSAQATLLSRPGRLLVAAGDLPDDAISDLFTLVDNAWQVSTTASDSLIRFVTLPDVGEFLLYSAQVENGMILSMAFHADTPVRAIRRQARRLSESLDLIPEVPEPPAAKTLPSRPTDPQPPTGLREATADQEIAPDEFDTPIPPPHEEKGPYTAYTCVWLPNDPSLELTGDLMSGLSAWIQDIAQENRWDLDELNIWPDYVLFSLRVPQKLLADEVMTQLMDETSRLSAEYFANLTHGAPLWADAYFVVSPPRTLTDREIARFITYQHQAQIG